MQRSDRTISALLVVVGGCVGVQSGSGDPGSTPRATQTASASSPTAPASAAQGPAVHAPSESVSLVAEPAAEPAYDLAADIEARRKDAREQIGRRAIVEVVQDVFVVAYPSGSSDGSNGVGVTKVALKAYLNGRFARKPTRALTVLLYGDAGAYEAYCKRTFQESCSTPYGFYTHENRHIVMNVSTGVGTLTHELVHPLVEADFPKAPDWINEGIASLFEQPLMGIAGQIHGGKNWRHPRLLQAIQSKSERDHASLPALFSMSDREFRGAREGLNYATARYLCQWLDQKNLLWKFYQRWRDDYASDPTGAKSFEAVVGKSPAEADSEWVQWVRRL